MGSQDQAQAPTDAADPVELTLRDILGGDPSGSSGGSDAAETAGAGTSPKAPLDAGTIATTPKGTQAGTVKLAGREYPSLEEASKAHGALYGKYAEGQQILNWFKERLKTDPGLMEKLAGDPKWSGIAAKLGMQAAIEDLQRRRSAGRGENAEEDDQEDEIPVVDPAKLPPEVRPMWDYLERQRQEFAVWRELQQLRWEESEFEKELKRPLTADEKKAVYGLLERAQGLTVKEAWILANHERMLREAVAKASAKAAPNKSREGRPAPVPGVGIPGVPLDLKKDPLKMNPAEWREYLKQTEEFQKLM